jgi:hypothetical protein
MDPMTPFVEGGWPTYVVLGCAIVTHPLALGAVAIAFSSDARRGLAIGLSSAALVLALLTAVVGVVGYLTAMQIVDAAVVMADPEMREVLRAQGRSEASWNLVCGALGAAIPILLALAGLVRGAMIRDGAPMGPRG